MITALARLLQTALALALPFLVLPAWSLASPILTNSCATIGLSGTDGWVSCAGGCDPGHGTCGSKSGTDSVGTFKYCACCLGANCDPEPSCCHLVARSKTTLDIRGLCTYPDCDNQTGHTCQLVSNQPVCAPPPPE